MTEEILRILLSDLATVRITCAKCKVVSEMQTSKLFDAFSREKKCPHCSQPFDARVIRSLNDLSRAIEELADARTFDQIAVEFIARKQSGKP
jgi:hypothetical protein